MAIIRIQNSYILLLTALLLFQRAGYADDVSSATLSLQDTAATDTRKIIIYYFHGDIRCFACLNIEHLTQKTVNADFSEQLASGVIEWRIINFDQPGNEHYAVDYKLPSPSVILSEFQNGKETRWKNLDKIWEREADKHSFIKYVREEIKVFYGAKQ